MRWCQTKVQPCVILKTYAVGGEARGFGPNHHNNHSYQYATTMRHGNGWHGKLKSSRNGQDLGGHVAYGPHPFLGLILLFKSGMCMDLEEGVLDAGRDRHTNRVDVAQ